MTSSRKFTKKDSYAIKGTHSLGILFQTGGINQALIKSEVGKLFCQSHEQKPDDKDLQVPTKIDVSLIAVLL